MWGFFRDGKVRFDLETAGISGGCWDIWDVKNLEIMDCSDQLLGGGFKDFLFSPLVGEMMKFD